MGYTFNSIRNWWKEVGRVAPSKPARPPSHAGEEAWLGPEDAEESTPCLRDFSPAVRRGGARPTNRRRPRRRRRAAQEVGRGGAAVDEGRLAGLVSELGGSAGEVGIDS
ncbi:hypothetical protein GUJ93_ZPchr0006g45818 [Zizania palustris]|uniref:Uncharacterized protein n=1 Tax=Zizania palustris TaxID=103762 RepID=A0A8J5STB0_ZIZPA|nr:hypothetical protein GUJ93_ZPchr0006g45818 [Zizania palustris]